MKLSIPSSDLKSGLARAIRAIAIRSTLPVLANVKLTADDGGLTLCGTNLEFYILARVSAKVEKPGAITLPAKTLADLVNTLPADEVVELTLNPKLASVSIQCGRIKANLKGIPADEFPSLPDVDQWTAADLDARAVAEALQSVLFAAATDEAHPILTGILLRTDKESGATFAASDGFRVAQRQLSLSSNGATPALQTVIPAKALRELAAMLSGAQAGGTLEMRLNPERGQVFFAIASEQLMAQTIEGAFPAYQNILPKSYTTRAVLEANGLRAVLKAGDVFARESAHTIRFKVSAGTEVEPGALTILATATETGEGEGALSASVEGPAIEVGLNVKFLLEALSAIKSPHVALELNTPTSPVVLRPIGAADDYLYVQMPMHLSR